MFCSNCGAEITLNDKNCPYCGMLNAYGAERAYMKELEQIRKDTENLEGLDGEDLKKEVKGQVKSIFKVLLFIAFGIIAFIVALFILTIGCGVISVFF
ncbi:MAG: zinc ribbon domain-containing protein [Lachnospiraceae bacterium]|nr:zinc ribbon domain-containing protein [Candidatus Equihabitans merdae]